MAGVNLKGGRWVEVQRAQVGGDADGHDLSFVWPIWSRKQSRKAAAVLVFTSSSLVPSLKAMGWWACDGANIHRNTTLPRGQRVSAPVAVPAPILSVITCVQHSLATEGHQIKRCAP